MSGFNWDDLRVFLTFVRTGNAYDAAQALSIDHTTVRRRIRALEAALSTKLVSAAGNNLTLSDGGKDLYRSLEAVEANIMEVSTRVSGADRSYSGRVRVGAPDGLGSLFLAPQLAQLRQKHPGLIIDLLTISRQFNVASREADVAIIISYPPPSRHAIRKLGTVNLRLCAATEYLESRPEIRSISDLSRHEFVGYLDDHPFIPNEVSSRPEFQPFRNVSFASNSVMAQVSAVAAGAGIGLLPAYVARNFPNLRTILPDQVVVPIDFYLLIHADLRNIARFRVTADFIADVVEREATLFE